MAEGTEGEPEGGEATDELEGLREELQERYPEAKDEGAEEPRESSERDGARPAPGELEEFRDEVAGKYPAEGETS